MTTEDFSPTPVNGDAETRLTGNINVQPPGDESTLRCAVERSMARYFEQLDGDTTTNLYDLVMNEVEGPLLEAVLRHTGSNQSRASIMLGLNRGTLRKKMKQHGLL
ncbi:MAG: DNA-binding transcriptional regulator Fis [Pseudohongiellaceae bacterium]